MILTFDKITTDQIKSIVLNMSREKATGDDEVHVKFIKGNIALLWDMISHK